MHVQYEKNELMQQLQKLHATQQQQRLSFLCTKNKKNKKITVKLFYIDMAAGPNNNIVTTVNRIWMLEALATSKDCHFHLANA